MMDMVELMDMMDMVKRISHLGSLPKKNTPPFWGLGVMEGANFHHQKHPIYMTSIMSYLDISHPTR